MDDELLQAARVVRAHAHAPYSGFAVGAALRDEQGRVHVGCNVENAAYPEGMCAEAGAIATMVAAGDRLIDVIVVVCDGEGLGTPCGGCRQKISEFADERTMVHVAGPEGIRASYTVAQLLPDSFGPEHVTPGG